MGPRLTHRASLADLVFILLPIAFMLLLVVGEKLWRLHGESVGLALVLYSIVFVALYTLAYWPLAKRLLARRRV